MVEEDQWRASGFLLGTPRFDPHPASRNRLWPPVRTAVLEGCVGPSAPGGSRPSTRSQPPPCRATATASLAPRRGPGRGATEANAPLDCRAGPFSASGQRRRGCFSRQPRSARGSHPLEVHHAVRDVGRKAPSGGPRVSVSGRPCGVVRTKPGGVQFFQRKGEATERGAGRHQENRLTAVNASSRLPQCRHDVPSLKLEFSKPLSLAITPRQTNKLNGTCTY